MRIAIRCVFSALAAEPYPARPIRCIVNSAPDGSPDLIMRSLGRDRSVEDRNFARYKPSALQA